MQHKLLLFVIALIPTLMACSNDNTNQAKPRQIGVGSDEPIIKKKSTDSHISHIGVPPVYSEPKQKIDYSQSVSIEEATKKKSILPPRPSYIFPWENDIRNKPLSYIKNKYEFKSKDSIKSVVNLIAYTPEELAIINNAFPNTENIKIKSIFDGDTIVLNNSFSKKHPSFKADENKEIKARLMNIDCPELGQFGGEQAKTALKKILSLPSDIKGDEKLDLKIRFRDTAQKDNPLVILTLDAGDYELSVNRSLVYSGACFTYAQYNQDQLMLSIQDFSERNKKGVWSQKIKLMATEEWVMPWVYRESRD